KASYLKLQIDRKEQEKNELQQKLGEANEELKKLNDKIAEIKSENEQKRKQIVEITNDIERKGEVEQVQLNREVEGLKIEITKKNSRVDTIKNELIKIANRKNDLKGSIQEVKQKISSLEEEKKSMEKEIAAKSKERDFIGKRILEFRHKNKLDNIGDIEKQIEWIDKSSEELQKEVQSAREQQHNLIREKDAIAHNLSMINAQISKVAEVEKENKKLMEEVKSKRDEFKKSTLELNKRLEEDSMLVAKLIESRKRLAASEEEMGKLKVKELSSIELSHSDIAVKKIIELKKSNPRIYGTVAELGNVKSRYALALEIAAGNKLKSVVVEDDKIASECIKYLKENKLGVVTFYPLNKIKPNSSSLEIKKLSESRGSHGLAIDLIEFEGKFKRVFEQVFSDTIVVDNIDVARRLGIGSAKFVTIDGDVAEKSGAMRGGFRMARKHSIGFREQDVLKEMEKNEQEVEESRGIISVLEKRRAENEEQITRLRAHKAAVEGEAIKMEKSLHLEASDLEASEGRKAELQELEKETDKKIRLVQEKIANLNSELAAIKTEKQNLRLNISQLSNPALLAELNAFEQKLKELDESVIRIDSEIKNINTHSESIYRNDLEKSDKIIKQLDKENDDFNSELKKLTEEIKQKNKELNEREALAQEFYAKFKELFHERAEIDKEIQKNLGIMGSRQDESRKVEVRANTLSLKAAEVISILSGLNFEFQQYEGVKLDLSKSEDQLKNDIRKFEDMKEQIGSVNMRALEIYEEAEKHYNELADKKDKLGTEKEDVVKMMDEIESKKKYLFMKVFHVINETFQRFFTMLTTKGAAATLVVENEENPFEAGVRINVKITGSKFLDIRSLSGGEKTMTALAFIFAIQEHEPASFYVLDEVDAALDKHNSEKFAKLIRQYSNKAQYLIMSHNDAVISEADSLYGISMNEHGISQVVTLRV
ncbi:MAG: AAA family ATPase, partial [Nanoarchaeota archaeon]